MRVTGVPVKLGVAPGRVRQRAPRLGEHTRTVLSQMLELSSAELDQLAGAGVID